MTLIDSKLPQLARMPRNMNANVIKSQSELAYESKSTIATTTSKLLLRIKLQLLQLLRLQLLLLLLLLSLLLLLLLLLLPILILLLLTTSTTTTVTAITMTTLNEHRLLNELPDYDHNTLFKPKKGAVH